MEGTLSYLKKYILKKEVFLKFDKNYIANNNKEIEAYVYLKNKIFINSYLIKSGLAVVDKESEFDMKSHFLKIEENYQQRELLYYGTQNKK
ncbi:MAG: thermonuclease family protein [Persephonella sp.]|nr:thermonuclease family protein [Persephonella sp.]